MSEHTPLEDESTYVVDAENAAEMARLMTMARQVAESMGNLFPPHVDPASVHAVLDIACGPGQWALDVAQTYPHIQATGGDISHLMIDYATTLARDTPNAHFQVMDAQRPLPFPDQSFDVLQARFITAFMLTSAWPKLLSECLRVLRPGGTLQLIEGENFGLSNRASLELCNVLLAKAMRRAGHCFAPEGSMFGITPLLPRLLREQGFTPISQRAFALDFSADQPGHDSWYANFKTGMKLVQPFLVQTQVTTQPEVDVLYERAIQDLQSTDFCGQAFYLAVSGVKPL